jgi:hypothetical protein
MRPLLLALTALILLSSCSKKEETPPDLPPCQPLMTSHWRIAEESGFTGPDTVLYQRRVYIYDASDRQIFLLTSAGGPLDTADRLRYYPDRIERNSVVYHLNSAGLATDLDPFFFYKYDTAGYCTEQTRVYSGGASKESYLYNCYNCSQSLIEHFSSLGIGYDTVWNEYYPDKSNTTGNENHGISFLGKQNNALLKSRRMASGFIENYSYLFDSQSRVTWEIITDGHGNKSYRSFLYR